MELLSIVKKDGCRINISEKSKDAVIRRLAEIAASIDTTVKTETIYTKLMERERQGSTGFGNGIAIPHTRIAGMKEFVLFIATSRSGVDFDSIDKKKAQVFFTLIGPEEQVNEHLKLLAGISRVLANPHVKKELLQAETPEVLAESFLRNVRNLEKGAVARKKMKALFVVLYIEDFFYNILEFFIEEGIEGATVFESSGMGEYISNIPLFASFIGFMNENKNQSKTIMALVPDERLGHLIEGIEAITGDLDKKEGAMIFAIDVAFQKGTMRMM